MDVKTYDPKQYSLVIAGIPVSGFADGTFFKASRSADSFSKYVGTMGEVSRAHNHDRTGEFAFTLARTSPYNDILSALAKRDEEKNAGVVPIIITDETGITVCSASKAWIRKWPDNELAKEVNTFEWIFDVAEYEVFITGTKI